MLRVGMTPIPTSPMSPAGGPPIEPNRTTRWWNCTLQVRYISSFSAYKHVYSDVEIGSSITLFGDVDQCNLDIWLDGSSSNGSPDNGRLAQFTGLERKEHRILMTVHPFNNGSISFYGAQIDDPVEDAPP
jgi:hypothetical protein